jgi:uncharacterized protein (TIGR02246 family)
MRRGFLILAVLAAPAALAQPARSGSVEARLQRVEDDLAIRRILVDYAAFLDGRDYDRYAALFAPDGSWTNATGAHQGRAAIRQMLAGTLGPAGAPNRANFHIISNPQVDVDGDRATATSRYLFVMRGSDGRPVPSLAGIYRDELVRRDGRWQIKARVADDIMPTPEEWRKIVGAR